MEGILRLETIMQSIAFHGARSCLLRRGDHGGERVAPGRLRREGRYRDVARRGQWVTRCAENGPRVPREIETSPEEVAAVQQLYTRAFGVGYERELGEELLQQVRDLPGTQNYFDYVARTASLIKWKHALQKGILPHKDEVTWPAEPFRGKFSETLRNIEMLSFTRRYPKLLNSLLKQMVELANEFEKALLEMENDQASKTPPSNPPSPSQRYASDSQGQQDDQSQNGQSQPSEEEGEGEGQTVEVQLSSNGSQGKRQDLEALRAEMEKVAEELVSEFEEEMAPVMDSLQKAKNTFQDLEELFDEEHGFDYSSGIWRRSGWQEMEMLRRKLEDLKELRDLVRSLGRSGGRGPKRKAPAQISKSGCPPGVVRSALQPEETTGLCRSGDLSRMLPSEAALMAAGWPKNRHARQDDEKHRRVSRGARLLHLARRAERNLFSYERSGWLEDEPSRVLQHLEYRPAAEQGPIIVCLDTSGSMQGVRETVAKAVVLECLRGAHKQQRNCYLYAFSGYGDMKELDLSFHVSCLPQLLDFLEYSFHGGTDVTRALELSIDRVQTREWAQADILIVTDGEMGTPGDSVLHRMESAKADLGLNVHGLLVGNSTSDAMTQICSHLHVFQSWDTARSASSRR